MPFARQTQMTAEPAGMSAVRPVVRVVGIGSPHGDDQIGWRLVEAVEGALDAEAEYYRASSPLDLIDHMGGCARVVIIDACCSGRSPGSAKVFEGGEAFFAESPARSCHALGVGQALALAQALGRCNSEIALFAVEAGRTAPGSELSPELTAALPRLVAQLRALIEAEDRSGKGRSNPRLRDRATSPTSVSYLTGLAGPS
jgi:hydrogenase maturation protease